ncbi:MerR family transcriptional regulator [Actinomadura fulvescens]|uniref:MerR family transcriptional regulator n=1 Tax=Actinomadura fulvescens TaxID=46160 RepID=A0ABP6D994_9ACTN
MARQHMQIGQVAEQTGLSLRTIRHYEEVGLAPPTARSTGGFRLYTDTDIARLRVIMRMKPLDFTLDQMRDLLTILDHLADPDTGDTDRTELTGRLATYRDQVQARCAKLRDRLAAAENFAAELGDQVHAHQPPAT